MVVTNEHFVTKSSIADLICPVDRQSTAKGEQQVLDTCQQES